MQLVAYGAQDVYLTGNPQITFFKVVYRRHTNFSMESIQQTINGDPAIGKRVSCNISRNGDLIHKIYLQMKIDFTLGVRKHNDIFKALTIADDIGHRIIKYVDLDIGGTRIDRQYGLWMEIWSELTITESQKAGYDLLVDGYKNVKTTTDGDKINVQIFNDAANTKVNTIGDTHNDGDSSRYSENI